MAGLQRDYLVEVEVEVEEEEEEEQELGRASAPLTSSYLPSRSMTHFMYLIVKRGDL